MASKDQKDQQDEETNVKVMVRVRPFNKREIDISDRTKRQLQSIVKMRPHDNTCVIVDYLEDDHGIQHEREREAFAFDKCFWSLPPEQDPMTDMPFATQRDVYNESGKEALDAAMRGLNVCIFAYGQTGSGKTHSMLGNDADPGISPRLVDDLFQRLQAAEAEIATMKSSVEVMFYEIYNEKVRDLFGTHLKQGEYDAPRIRQHPTKGVYVEGLVRHSTSTAQETKDLMEKGTGERAMAATKMNPHSSRSHAVFQLRLLQKDALKGTARVSTINLVDLAGSERIKMSGVVGDNLREAKNINLSLGTLRRVIDTLIENSTSRHKKPPPFRDSVLTYLLSDSLGGNSKTMMLSAISPHESNVEDTMGTLRYALRAKAIVCTAHVNEEKSKEMVDAMRNELLDLRRKMATGEPIGGSFAGSGVGSGPPPEEIQELIQERENEIRQMEEEQNKMEDMLEEAKRKEEVIQAKYDEVQEQQQQLSLAVNEQKRERFATAFRNAFLIATDKKRIESSNAELLKTKAERELLLAECDTLRETLRAKEAELEDTSSRGLETSERLAEVEAKTAEEIAELTKNFTAASDDKNALRVELEKMSRSIKVAELEEREAKGIVQRIQADLVRASHKAEQSVMEKQAVSDRLEATALDHNDEVAEMRRGKEKYKTLFTKAKAQCAAFDQEAKEIRKDRQRLIQTVTAQQHLLEERGLLLKRAETMRSAAEAKAETFERELECSREEGSVLVEALKEHQTACQQWMSDHAQQQKEIKRLKELLAISRGQGPF